MTKSPAHPPIVWLNYPEEHDFAAAADYLALLDNQSTIAALIQGLRDSAIIRKKAKDILRASRLPLLSSDNPHVASDLAKINAGKKISPILLVRGDRTTGIATQVADGYHRVCASYLVDENTDIPALMVDPTDLPDRTRSYR